LVEVFEYAFVRRVQEVRSYYDDSVCTRILRIFRQLYNVPSAGISCAGYHWLLPICFVDADVEDPLPLFEGEVFELSGRTAWDETFQPAAWQAGFAAAGVDPAFYAHRERGRDEVLPWSRVDAGWSQADLWDAYQEALACAASCGDASA
jgi:hypothetical protein